MAGMSDLKKQWLKDPVFRAEYDRLAPEFAEIRELVEAHTRAGLALPHEVAARHLAEAVPLLRAWREYLGLTQAELAERLAVTQGQVAQWEAPGARPRHATLKRAAAALGLHVSQLTLADV